MDQDLKITIVVVVLTLFLVLSSWFGASAMEAKAFNRATGKNVSTWDAMWVKLRVQGTAGEIGRY